MLLFKSPLHNACLDINWEDYIALCLKAPGIAKEPEKSVMQRRCCTTRRRSTRVLWRFHRLRRGPV
ncbi:hypothetical protein BN874_1640006 [Candidatus Contendobacter odensis Run_B_J11]|uniref:Uncharacterized protein n=1 Tax=Candidatus Contendobacter odensis Run_B_J11 TaxID=1400861 RepID=A0A7U7G9T4_9GAMM|nr:hypothetical protein BN874_1640006 [Candidatus Contendobacter odensis Run_B_J11]